MSYKAGYDTGPSNPLPQNEREEVLFAKKKIIDDANDYFVEMKTQTEERKEREAQWRDQELSEQEKTEKAEARRLKREAKKRKKLESEKKESEAMPEIDPMAYGYAQDGNPDNPANYVLPDPDNVNVFGEFSKGKVDSKCEDCSQTKKAKEAAKKVDKDLVEGPIKPPGEEDDLDPDMQVSHEQGDTRMVVVGEGNYLWIPGALPQDVSHAQRVRLFVQDSVREGGGCGRARVQVRPALGAFYRVGDRAKKSKIRHEYFPSRRGDSDEAVQQTLGQFHRSCEGSPS